MDKKMEERLREVLAEKMADALGYKSSWFEDNVRKGTKDPAIDGCLAAMFEAYKLGLSDAAEIAEGEVYRGNYRTWAWWEPDRLGNRGNVTEGSALSIHSKEIASAIRTKMEK